MKNVVTNDSMLENKGTFIGASLLIHAIILAALFVTYHIFEQENQKHLATKQLLPTQIEPPVLLYYAPAIQPSLQKEAQKAPLQKQPSFSKESLPLNADKDVLKSTENTDLTTQKTEKQKDAHKEKPQSIQSKPEKIIKKQATHLISLPQEPTTEQKKFLQKSSDPKNPTTDSDEIRKRKLTLADLFKTMPHIIAEFQKNGKEGNGEQLVIAQGDIRYYSFLKKFITHMNQVFAFNNGPETLQKWAQEGLIKKNVGISIIIDRKGKVLETIFLSPSGYQPFDELTLKTVQAASPFPPVPELFKEKTVRVNLTSGL